MSDAITALLFVAAAINVVTWIAVMLACAATTQIRKEMKTQIALMKMQVKLMEELNDLVEGGA